MLRLKEFSKISDLINPESSCSTRAPRCHIHMTIEHFWKWGLHHFPKCLLQSQTTLSVKKLFPIFNLNLSWNSLRPFSLILSLVPWGQSPTPTWLPLLSGSCGDPEALLVITLLAQSLLPLFQATNVVLDHTCIDTSKHKHCS